MNLSDMQNALRHFAEERNWRQFHTPRNLLLALVGEVGELAAEFQWIPDSELEGQSIAVDTRDRIQHEAADVLIYLLQLADVLDVDLSEAFKQKLALNALKYPIEKSFGKRDKYTQFE